eukprot:TRINITY_DN7295_c0_g1_i1.p1 TRINITY_DN7295_c0_g1~~TRINITY_DN7295_c0_g1_i1.p1  ORF type:complete len:113 (-),score=39.01 TRINITY_DN7295_c0_g1_i1:494-832(-)
MKIDEPDTPYHYPGDYSVSDSEEEEGKASPPVAKGVNLVEVNWDELQQKMEIQKKRQDLGFDLVVNPEREAVEKDRFLKKRRMHYCEGQMLKQAKALEKEEEDEESSEVEPK